MENEQYVLYTDWTKEGMRFVLYAGDHVIWMGSKANGLWSRHVSSFLGELKTIVWALHECIWILRGSDVVVRTDSDSRRLRLTDQAQWVKEKDARILRLMGWLLGNWGVGSQLTFEHVSGVKNEVADVLSRWTHQESVEGGRERKYVVKGSNLA